MAEDRAFNSMSEKFGLLHIFSWFIIGLITVACQSDLQSSTGDANAISHTIDESVSRPAARYFHALAYDSEREVIVMFAGQDKEGNILSDTWEYSNSFWTQVNPLQSPPSRRDHAMIYSEERDTVMLFGGAPSNDEFTYTDDLWEYDGNTWIQLATQSPGPSPRRGMSMVYDSNRSLVFLYGGNGPLWDFWQFDGKIWHELLLESPIMGAEAAFTELVYDSNRDVTVLYGLWGNTYEFDGQRWQMTATLEPDVDVSVYDIKMIYDTHRKLVVLTGVNPNENTLNTWEYDGTKWTRVFPSNSPPIRTNYAMAFDEDKGITILFGGQLLQNNEGIGVTLNDTWEYDGVTWIQK